MARMQAAEMVLQQMQVLDQQIVAPLALAEQRQDLVDRGRVNLPALRMIEAAPPAGAGMDAAIVFRGRLHACSLNSLSALQGGRGRGPSRSDGRVSGYLLDRG